MVIKPPPTTVSHGPLSKPSILLALACLAIVHRLRPQWLAINLAEAARAEQVSPQRLSRLCTAAISPFEEAIVALTRRGRPPHDREADDAEREIALLRALLGVATAILRHVPKRTPSMRALLVCAWQRLHTEHPRLHQKRFCEAIAVPVRTFRNWLKAAPTQPDPSADPIVPTPSPGLPRHPRPLRRPRFTFDVTVPDTRIAADTTNISAFGVPLKLMAAQDIGGRDQDLLDAVIVDDRECADHIIDLFKEAIGEQPGMQALTDQGTPYMAEATRTALEELGVEHAAQREADPIGKSTIERAFGLLKPVASTLLGLTDRLVDVVPALRSTELAKATTTVVITALLRAYQLGARAARRAEEQRAGIDPDTLAQLAQEQRDDAVARDRSARLLLSHLHSLYEIQRPITRFIRDLRNYPLEILHAAERQFGAQVHRSDIKDRASYFCAIVRRLYRELRERQDLRRREQQERDAWRETPFWKEKHAAWRADPMSWLYEGLDGVAGSPLCEFPASILHGAIDHLINLHGPDVTADLVRARFADLMRDRGARIDPRNIQELAKLLDSRLPPCPDDGQGTAASFVSTILGRAGSKPSSASP